MGFRFAPLSDDCSEPTLVPSTIIIMGAALGTHSCKNLDVPEPAQLLYIHARSTETIHQRKFSKGPSSVRQTCPAVKQPVLFRRARKARLALYAFLEGTRVDPGQ